MAEELTPDICIIGGGPGGLAAAAAAAEAGASVVLVERGRLGGNNLTRGSVPSKALLASADVYAALRRAPELGVNGAPLQVDLPRVREHMATASDAIGLNYTPERLAAFGVTAISGIARFASPDLVAVETTAVRAGHFIIATGAAPAVPEIAGLDGAEALTFADAFDLTRRPSHLIVLGAGAYALEIAQAYARLGMDATVISETAALPECDPELATIVVDRLRAEGIGLRAGAKVTQVARRRSGLRLSLIDPADGEMSIDGSHLLVAGGRQPDVEALGLAAAGIAAAADGIAVDGNLRTTNRRVHAIGDAIAGPPLAGRARLEGTAVVRNILRRVPVRSPAAHVPSVAFTDPGLVEVGLSENEARVRHRAIRVARIPYAGNDRAAIEHDPYGVIKVVATASGNRVLGAGIVGRHAAELIAPFALAIANRLGLEALSAFVPPYPTRSELAPRLATGDRGGAATLGAGQRVGSLTEEWLKRIIGTTGNLG
ncbi:MAG TPA: NAD(P)/FAD-dependent oxidoreductase [Bauldia sp.]|nr:NAD(P)/FAD-dependent oxidoreductase [Bauldia sp.]